MTGLNLVSFERKDGDKFVYIFETGDSRSLSAKIGKMFGEERYKLEEGTMQSGVYGKGSSFLRTFLGGFVKRYRFSIDIIDKHPQVHLIFSKAMSGALGGVMGYRSLNKEFERIAEQIKTLDVAG